jgi:hypothetical protein
MRRRAVHPLPARPLTPQRPDHFNSHMQGITSPVENLLNNNTSHILPPNLISRRCPALLAVTSCTASHLSGPGS